MIYIYIYIYIYILHIVLEIDGLRYKRTTTVLKNREKITWRVHPKRTYTTPTGEVHT